MNSATVSKFSKYMTQHTDKVPLLSVQSIDDKRFTVLRESTNFPKFIETDQALSSTSSKT